MDKRINHIILTFVLCFSLAFVAYPLKGFSYDIENGGDTTATTKATTATTKPSTTQYTILEPEDEAPPGTICIPISQLGAYDVVDDSFGPESTVGEYVWIAPIPTTTKPTTTTKKDTTTTTKKDTTTTTKKDTTTTTGGGTTGTTGTTTGGTPPSPPPTSSQYVRRCVLIYSYTPCADTCGGSSGNGPGTPPPPPPPPKYSCNKSNWTCYQDSSGIYSSLSRCQDACVEPPCMIDYFEFPKRAWVGYSITGKWSASAWCEDCDVTCSPYPECVWKQNNIGIGFDKYKFTIKQSGTYTYTLTCYKQGGADQRQATVILEALNLPWWREIIPVLPGSLFSFWPWE